MTNLLSKRLKVIGEKEAEEEETFECELYICMYVFTTTWVEYFLKCRINYNIIS